MDWFGDVFFIISTHAPLAGRDSRPSRSASSASIFQPTRPLRGATQRRTEINESLQEFQPTRPLRGATCRTRRSEDIANISTHAPLAGRDDSERSGAEQCIISTHAPLAGRDPKTIRETMKRKISTHAPLAGRDSKSVQITMHIFAITDKFQMFLRKMPTVRAFCFFFVREKRANFSANRPDNFCALVLRTIRASVPRADTSACSRSVRFYSRTSCPSSKIEGCPFLGQ